MPKILTRFLKFLLRCFGSTPIQFLFFVSVTAHYVISVVLLNNLFGHTGYYNDGLTTIAVLCQIIYMMNAFASRNVLQLRFVLVNLAFSIIVEFIPILMFLIINSMSGGAEVEVVLLGIELVAAVIVIPLLLRKTEQQIGWQQYRILGASDQLQRMWRNYQMFIVHIKGICVNIPTMFTGIQLAARLIDHATNRPIDDRNSSINVAESAVALIGMLLCIPMALVACRKEKRWLINIVLVYYIAHSVMCIVMLISFDNWATEAYFAVLLLWTLLLLYYGVNCARNFGKGLLPYFDQINNGNVVEKPRDVDLEQDHPEHERIDEIE